MDVDVFLVTSYRMQKKFLGYVATFEHDVLDFIGDSVSIKSDEFPETIFFEKVETLLKNKAFEGRKFSLFTFTMHRTGEQICAPAELLEWVEKINITVKANGVKFTQVVQ